MVFIISTSTRNHCFDNVSFVAYAIKHNLSLLFRIASSILVFGLICNWVLGFSSFSGGMYWVLGFSSFIESMCWCVSSSVFPGNWGFSIWSSNSCLSNSAMGKNLLGMGFVGLCIAVCNGFCTGPLCIFMKFSSNVEILQCGSSEGGVNGLTMGRKNKAQKGDD